MRSKDCLARVTTMIIHVRSIHPLINCICCVFLCISSAITLHAQKVDTSFTLLWYKGKKINDTTVSNPAGVVFIYSPSEATVTASYPVGKDPLQSIRNEVAGSEQAMITIDEAITGPAGDRAAPALVVAANQAIERANQDASTALNNTVKIKPPPPPPTVQEKVEWLKTWPSDIAANYSAVLAYLSHPNSATFTSAVPPPDYSYDYCFPCDAARKKAFHDDSLAFMNSFLSEENLNLDRAKSVMAYLQPDTLNVLNLQARQTMFNAIVSIAKRIETKVVGAWNQYGKVPSKVPFMVRLLIDANRNQELMGFETAGFPSFLQLGATLLNTIKQVLDKARQEKDYTVLLNRDNIYFIKYAQSFGLSPEGYGLSIYDLVQLWEFQVDIDASAKIEGKDLMESAELHYDGAYFAHSDSACRLKWERKGFENSTGIGFDLKQIALRGGKYTGTYTGTKIYGAKRPLIRLDFCDKTRDTADFYPFFPYGGVDSWNLGRQTGMPFQVVHRVFMSTFMDEASLRKRAMSMQQSTMDEQVSTLEQQQANSGDSHRGTMTPKDYERAAKLLDIEDEKLKISWYNALYYFPVRGQLKNREQMVFDETLDGKKISKFPNTVYATYHVKIKHIED